MKKQKHSRFPKIPSSAIITAFVIAVIALSFLVKPDFVKGLIMSIAAGFR